MTRKHITALGTLALLIVGMMSAPAAKADTVTFNLTPFHVFCSPGSPCVFSATVSTPNSNFDDVFLNGLAITDPAGATDDQTAFFSWPFSLAPNSSFGSAAIFSINVPGGISGDYFGTIDLIGGADFNAQDILGSAQFEATVTPEPATLIMLGSGLGMAAGFWRRRTRR